ncbi:MAG: RluA family pseudouridine synthase [Alphaproteobacteria bacterium]|nr:RluA family pseudouridine synthase [Alphaproteobacteria bacterium]
MPTITIDINGEGVRLDRYLRRIGFYFPQNLFEKWSRQGKLRINDAKAKASSRLSEGDSVIFPDDAVPMPPPEEVTPLFMTQREAADYLKPLILFEDNNMIVLNKPSGLATQGGTGQRTSVDDIFRAYSQNVRCKLTHRIDKETSGILLIAKNSKTATDITDAFRKRIIQKTYMAVCQGTFDIQSGTIDTPIGRCDSKIEKMSADAPDAREAVTHFEVDAAKVKDLNIPHTRVILTPKTGRTHQLRVHMSDRGNPILGDKKYGGPSYIRLMLHAWKISFSMSGKNYTFEAPLPETF